MGLPVSGRSQDEKQISVREGITAGYLHFGRERETQSFPRKKVEQTRKNGQILYQSDLRNLTIASNTRILQPLAIIALNAGLPGLCNTLQNGSSKLAPIDCDFANLFTIGIHIFEMTLLFPPPLFHQPRYAHRELNRTDRPDFICHVEAAPQAEKPAPADGFLNAASRLPVQERGPSLTSFTAAMPAPSPWQVTRTDESPRRLRSPCWVAPIFGTAPTSSNPIRV